MAAVQTLRKARKVVLLAESALCGEALGLALEQVPWLQVATSESAGEVADLVARTAPDALLLQLPLVTGVPVLRWLRETAPVTHRVALDTGTDEHELLAWADAGATVCLPRGSSIDDVVRALEGFSVGIGDVDVESESGGGSLRLPQPSNEEPLNFCALGLTRRQAEVFALLTRGLSNKQIGVALSIEVATVKNHVHSILERLDVASRLEAIVVGRQWSDDLFVPSLPRKRVQVGT